MRPSLDQILAIAPDFNSRYEIIIADTDALRREVYRIRCKVFCNDLGYAMQQRDGCEFDEYDADSIHVLLRQRNTGAAVGCFRIVMPQAQGTWLPFEHYGAAHVDERLFDWSSVERMRSVEISRLAIDSSKRQTAPTDSLTDASDPYLATALFYAVTAMVVKLDVHNVFMVIEPCLGRLTSRFGIRLDQIGAPFEYYGQRATFTTTGARMGAEASRLNPAWRALYDVVLQQLFVEQATQQVA
ncbi:MAG: hypothetical protein JWM78_1167 [Verrucomicrobiaceae bacterium]|nr:hypothetical protein [Verrucomicrobiaceae bacterium]